MPDGELHLTPVEHVHFGCFSVSLRSHPRRIAPQRAPHEDGGSIAGLDDEFRLENPRCVLQPLGFRLPIYQEERDDPDVLTPTDKPLD